jgi:hypothetical protein
MSDTKLLPASKYRLLVAIRYLNASRFLFEGMKKQLGVNNFHLLVTLRSFIEYHRRGIWFLAWASPEKLNVAEKLTFDQAGSPKLKRMDEMINEALGLGKVCYLLNNVPHVNEPFLNCLHALTHGNPISVRMLGVGLDKIFQSDKLLIRAEMELNIFHTLVYRRAPGEELKAVWCAIAPIHNRPDDVKKLAKAAATKVKEAGGLEKLLDQLQ